MDLDPRGGATRRRRVVRRWSVGLLPAVLLAAVAAAVTLRPGEHTASVPPTAAAGPVLLVSGYGGSTSSVSSLAAALKATGRTTLVVPPVGDNTGDLRDQARALDRAARSQVALGATSVDVVGYSAGGVVARIWVSELGGDALARRVVTLGSPHHGTDVAQLAAAVFAGACPLACHELAPGSDLLAGLPETPSGPSWTSIWTADDDVVTPASSAQLRGGVDIELQQVCPAARVSHGGLPSDPLTQALVVAALDGPPLTRAPSTPPAPLSCAGLPPG